MEREMLLWVLKVRSQLVDRLDRSCTSVFFVRYSLKDSRREALGMFRGVN